MGQWRPGAANHERIRIVKRLRDSLKRETTDVLKAHDRR